MESSSSTNKRVEIGIEGKRDLVLFSKMWKTRVI